MRRIAVDAMGTDSAPEAELEGAIQAARAGYAEVLLVGPQDRLALTVRAAGSETVSAGSDSDPTYVLPLPSTDRAGDT